MAATTQYGGGIHEPVKHERAFLLEFLEAVAEDNAEAASEVPEQQVYAAASFRSAERWIWLMEHGEISWITCVPLQMQCDFQIVATPRARVPLCLMLLVPLLVQA